MTDKLKNYYENYDYGARNPVYVNLQDLNDQQTNRLIYSDTFCILPWIHMHAFPDGRAYPCCLSVMEHPIGNLREQTMAEVWNDESLREMRRNMLADKPCKECTKCYEQEKNGFFSMRNAQNKNEGHHIGIVDETLEDGTLERFELKYYDIRFSNLCNLACRTCGDIFSSNWVKEAKKMGWLKQNHPNVQYAGRYEMDMWEQLEPHIDSIENIYFAGGEPLMMVEHYNLLRELLRRGRTDVRLNYNTNFTELVFKQQDVLDMWNEFDIVSIGASLDANYERGELMRKGTVWSKIVANRERMLEKCPTVDFYVSSTLSLMNSYNIVDFHKEWVELGLVKPQDWNVNILQDPIRFRLDVLPEDMKQELVELYQNHITWLEPQDPLSRATQGFKSAINFMSNSDNSKHIPEFVVRAKELDRWRNENFFSVFPELERLQDYDR
jgi:sulfatase maturation enzyme AslB (radical SAM superfamily)